VAAPRPRPFGVDLALPAVACGVGSQVSIVQRWAGVKSWGYPNLWMVYFMENPPKKWMMV